MFPETPILSPSSSALPPNHPSSPSPEGFLLKKCLIIAGSVLMQCLLLGLLFYGSFPHCQHFTGGAAQSLVQLWSVVWTCLGVVTLGLHGTLRERLPAMLLYLALCAGITVLQVVASVFFFEALLAIVFNVFWLTLVYSYVLDLKAGQKEEPKKDEG
ncbi:hypothetical protein TYRP_006516 [Tyrophagus putrescentiae]|nr:hypothetical protein TYRP_006516 [Tyrophagus putrescentiae]